MMSSDTRLALGEWWDDQSSAWRNFVTWVVREHKISQEQYEQLDHIGKKIHEHLAEYGLRMARDGSRKFVVGKPEDLTAWMLTYS